MGVEGLGIEKRVAVPGEDYFLAAGGSGFAKKSF
jgi:hypothetical protein